MPSQNNIPTNLSDNLPSNRLTAQKMLEVLCLEPEEETLDPVKHDILIRYLNQTYSNLLDEVPKVDDVICCLQHASTEDKAITDDLLKRLANNFSIKNN